MHSKQESKKRTLGRTRIHERRIWAIHKHQALESSMKLRQVGVVSSSLKSRKFVKGGNHDSMVRLRFRRPCAAAFDEESLIREGGFGVLLMMTMGIGSHSSSSSLMFIKLCRLIDIRFWDLMRPSRQANAADRLLRLTSDLMEIERAEDVLENVENELD